MRVQKRLAAYLMKCSKNKIVLDSTRLEDIKEAITKKDVRGLIKEKAIGKSQKNQPSRARARKIRIQKSKGRRKGPGSKKGKINSKVSKKDKWILKIRAQRKFIKELVIKKEITNNVYRTLYSKSKGGFFRSMRHISIYLDEHDLKLKKAK